MTKFHRLKDCVVTNKNVIVRVDINVPISNGRIEDDTRIKAVIPTIKYLAVNKAKVIVISHFGRPEGKIEPSMSINQLVPHIQKLLDQIKVHFVGDCIGEKVKKAISEANYGEVILLENLRFYKQETKNDAEFSRELASLANLYVNDAFSCSHRAHASIVGIPKILKSAAGFQMEAEIDNLNKIFTNSSNGLIAVVGGAKVSTKIDLLNSLAAKAQTIAVVGGMANTFLYALGNNIGKSLCEKELKDIAIKITETAKRHGCNLILPSDVVVVKKFEANAKHKSVASNAVETDDIIVDIGENSVKNLGEELKKHRILVWNGPLGAFELKPFNLGTDSFAKIAAELTHNKKLTSIAGGGDSVSAINSAGLANDFTYISTAGGAFLEWLEGKELPGVTALDQKSINN